MSNMSDSTFPTFNTSSSQTDMDGSGVDRGETPTQKTNDQISTDDRSVQFPSTYSPSKSKSGSDAKERALESWELFRDEYVDAPKSSEAQYTSLDSHNKSSKRTNKVSLPKLQDVPCHLFDQLKDELRDFTEKDMWRLSTDLRETFAKLFGITKIFPLYLDLSEFVMRFLDENECLFMWNEMECSIIYMGSDLEEGITNYLIHPNRMCYIIEDTFERVPVDEYEHQLEEEFKNHMEEGLKKKISEAKANLAVPKGKKTRKKSRKNK
ncbi:2469_t:CDS:2 [Paraglomus brasilianum]|uniref:2469_t:CDS:1 n=1 Tax=Paraglomus brasilianum TaxID=144538 RepID=A0A9N9A8W9_9GLOM|nr:2469_t:CDS:2 [Paraglomus brasilianum]